MATTSATFGAADCELMATFADGFRTKALEPGQRDALVDLRGRLMVVASTVGDRLAADWRAFEPGQSSWQNSGHVARDMWCCVYPKEAPHKSFGLQVALIIRPDGGELCFCLGAGAVQTSVPAKRQSYEQALDALRGRLRAAPTAILEDVVASMPADWVMRRAWRLPPGPDEFTDLGAWVAFAGSAGGAGASISRYLTRDQVESMGADFESVLVEAAERFRPLIDWAYSPVADADPAAVQPTPAPPVTYAYAATLDDLGNETLWAPEDLTEVIETLSSKRPHAILAGPPGTSKTWVARAIVAHLTEGDPGRVVPIQFHPSYTYEEFVEGLRPVAEAGFISFKPTQGTLFRAVDRASATKGSVYLLIDEINRANLSRVFGELMQLLEYRDTRIDLQYSAGFSLPPNLGIIATMNTADRSIRSIDVALRRRFEFFECPPSRDILERFYATGQGVSSVPDLGQGFDALNEWLTDQIDRHHTVGHTYLMAEVLDAARLRRIWKRQLLPLIEDFFFDRPDQTDDLDPKDFWPSLDT